MSLRHRLGALIYDWPRFLRYIGGDWTLIRNRREAITVNGRGVRCHWEFTSDLHIAKVYPATGRWLLRRALEDWPIRLRAEAPAPPKGPAAVSFVVGHRGLERLPQLLTTLRSLAAQTGVATECIVVEQSACPEIEAKVPSWVRYVHTPVPSGAGYGRAAAFNAGARHARGHVLVLHDNDMIVPERYAAELAARIAAGWNFVDPKRFMFYLTEGDTRRTFDRGALANDDGVTVVQNARGGSIAAAREAYFAIGGFDESFVGWGGEDLDFWERAEAHGGVYAFGHLPLIHLWHLPQPGKASPDAPAVRRYHEVRAISPTERIRRLRALQAPPP
jgi:hypothetical protein